MVNYKNIPLKIIFKGTSYYFIKNKNRGQFKIIESTSKAIDQKGKKYGGAHRPKYEHQTSL